MSALYRTQILLEPGQHLALAELSRKEGVSVSEIIRRMVREELERRQQDAEARRARQLAALDRLDELWERVMKERGGAPPPIDTVALIHEMREERDDAFLRRL